MGRKSCSCTRCSRAKNRQDTAHRWVWANTRNCRCTSSNTSQARGRCSLLSTSRAWRCIRSTNDVLLIENGSFRTLDLVKFSVASAGFGVPQAFSVAIDALAAFYVKLTRWARKWHVRTRYGVWTSALTNGLLPDKETWADARIVHTSRCCNSRQFQQDKSDILLCICKSRICYANSVLSRKPWSPCTRIGICCRSSHEGHSSLAPLRRRTCSLIRPKLDWLRISLACICTCRSRSPNSSHLYKI